MASRFALPFSRARRSANMLDLYVRLVIIAGLLVFGFLLRDAFAAIRTVDLTFWLLAACVFPAEVIRFTTQRGATLQLTLSRPFALALLTGWGVPLAVVVFVTASVVSDLNRRRTDPKPMDRVWFNAAQYVLSIATAGAIYQAFGGQPSVTLAQVPAFIAAALTLILVNQLLVRIVIAIHQQLPLTVALLLRVAQVELLEGAVQCGIVLVALMVAGHRPVLPLLLALPALPLVVAGRATARVEILSRTRSLGRSRESAELDERREAVQQILRAAELERVKLAADLHDGPLQHIEQFVMRIQQLQATIEAGRPDTQLAQLVDQLAKEATAESRNLRAIVAELRPPVLQRLGLVGALTHLAGEFQTTYGIVFDVKAPTVELSEELEVLLYRVTQEALTNVVKHACASHVQVTVAVDQDVARLQIHDDGTEGFDPQGVPEDGHYGLALMRRWVELAGGAFQVDSTPYGGDMTIGTTIGTTITVEIQRGPVS